ncbi:uncharacterized protein FYW49_009439 [Xenentodon cancila]
MMDPLTHPKRPITRSCSFGDATPRSATLDALTQTADQCQDGKRLPRQRRITVASYMPNSTDQNGNFPDKDVDRQVVKSLSELNTEEVCQWFTSIGLEKCLPFIKALERIVHLRTPKETTVGKIMDSCIKMLGTTDDKSLFTLREKQDSPEELSLDQQIGTILTGTSEKQQLELHLCKMDKPTSSASQNSPEDHRSIENSNINKNIQMNHPTKEDRIRELNQQVESLQSVIFQVQELHHNLVAFCSELKNMDTDVNLDGLGSAELKQRLEIVNRRLNDKRQSLQTLRDNMNNSTAHKKKQLEVRLVEKMKLNCQVFKEEISIVHLNRQVAQLQNALKERCIKEKTPKETAVIGSLSQLVSPRSPAMLMVVQENQSPDGRFGFTCHHRDGGGLVVVSVDNSQLREHDRLVEVNGVPVVNSTLEELMNLLLQGPCAEIVVLRQPPPILGAPQFLQHMVSPEPVQALCPERDAVTMETPPQRKVMAI